MDIRKNLDFIGMKNFSLSLNGALIKSNVKFLNPVLKKKTVLCKGQSPYLVNAGLFYQQPKNGWNAAILYNRIGKTHYRCRAQLGSAGNEVRVPDSYEMPRNAIDLSASKKFGKLEVKAAIRDVLAEKGVFQTI